MNFIHNFVYSIILDREYEVIDNCIRKELKKYNIQNGRYLVEMDDKLYSINSSFLDEYNSDICECRCPYVMYSKNKNVLCKHVRFCRKLYMDNTKK